MRTEAEILLKVRKTKMSAPKRSDVIAGVDYKQQTLCTACWDGNHYYVWETPHEVGRTAPIKRIVKTG